MSPSLAVVADADVRTTPKTETVAQRVRRLQAEAQQLARDHVRALEASMAQTEAIAREIATGGGVYHYGSQEMAGRIAESLESQLLTLRQIMGQAG